MGNTDQRSADRGFFLVSNNGVLSKSCDRNQQVREILRLLDSPVRQAPLRRSHRERASAVGVSCSWTLVSCFEVLVAICASEGRELCMPELRCRL
jgi:hypothetical protein